MKINRKDFFKGLALATISAPFAVKLGINQSQADAQERSSPQVITSKKYKWRMVTTWPPNFPILHEGCVYFADLVRKMSAGQLDIEIYGGGELIPPLESFNAVSSGAAELGHGASYYWAGRISAAQFFASVPFGLNAQGMNTWISQGGGLELWEALYAEHNLVPMMAGNTGVQMGGWFNRRIDSIDDFKGLKMRMPGLGGKVLQEVGAAAVLVAGSELYTSLERGVISATEWIGPYHDYIMGFPQIAKYYYAPGWHEPGSVLELIINKKKFDTLSPQLQSIVRAAAEQSNQWIMSAFEYQNSIYLEKILKEYGTELLYFPEETLGQLRTVANAVVYDVGMESKQSKKIYESFSVAAKKLSRYGDFTEKRYYNHIKSLSDKGLI